MLFCFTLTACGDAIATDDTTPSEAIKPVTQAECLAMEVKEDKIACFQKLTAQEREKQAQTQKDIQTLKAENDKRRERNEEMLREFEEDVLSED